MFDPTYAAALSRLNAFAPKAGRDYAGKRNYDNIAHVSALSPYIRHRMITEEDVLKTVLARHSATAAEKFIQEVYWRTYWKGWLELRPAVWDMYRADLNGALNRIQTESGLRQDWEAACKGETGIECFDHWARQLADTGYLHNHARMWFASIWIFTLRLPWTLGADFFMRHLLDGDPASNTLSWRWVGGLQTVGKTYLARPDNIAKYTEGRFDPKGLATFAAPLEGPPAPPRGAVPVSDSYDPALRTGLLITEEDLSPGWLAHQFQPCAVAMVQTTAARSPLTVSARVTAFVADAQKDAAARYADKLGSIAQVTPETVADWAAAHNIEQIVTPYIPTGPTRDALKDVRLCQIIRPYDSAAWPHATHGFFRFKDRIPSLLGDIKGLRLA
ncbi:deoxyribodipyrimidine photo-lyase [Loktanella sp. PT4BL]|jgi:deoxyribodipyrimidine photo-lyase|uniref:FAD-binding domain-containing protein n=1 Tax=Loktanella sp. PT4BL TaxID=2135611 RepID=UPI000D75D512|nr:FAD-binding domain-containing protein [Loktanella sp. PT4BL]PXW70882.1 deoxyribodipyrimidine photo-lyase [Loktanella sp. PT4BL]